MRAGKTKNKLADKILDFLGEGWGIDPDELYVNRGGNKYNDWCSWTGCVWKGNVRYPIHSWEPMSALIKAKKLTIVGEIDRLRSIEFCSS